jgi:hypothetical protein
MPSLVSPFPHHRRRGPASKISRLAPGLRAVIPSAHMKASQEHRCGEFHSALSLIPFLRGCRSTYPLIHPVTYWSLLTPGMAFRPCKKLHLITGNYGELQCQLRHGNYSTTFGVPIDRGCAFSVPSVENRRHSRTSNQTQSHLKKLGATTPLGAGTLLDGRATTPLGAAKVCLYLHRRLTSIREFTVAPVYSRGANPEVLFTPVCSCSSLSKTGVNRTKLDLTGVIRTKSAISAQRSCFIPHRQSSNSEVLGIIPKVVTTPARNNCELLGIKISGIAKIPGYSDLFRLIPSKTAISPTLVRTH